MKFLEVKIKCYATDEDEHFSDLGNLGVKLEREKEWRTGWINPNLICNICTNPEKTELYVHFTESESVTLQIEELDKILNY